MNVLTIDREGMPLVDKVLLKRYYPQKISDYQAEMMLHALGADNKPYRKYGKRRSYKAYRNYYDAGGEDIAAWDDLVDKGYAYHKPQSFYHVTVSGIRVLEYLTQCRIWDDYHNVADCRKAVLEELMKDDVSCGWGCWLPTSSRDISLRLAIPRQLVLDTLHQLAEEGLAEKGYEGGADDEGYVYCQHGWWLTQLAREKYAERHNELQKEEYKRINDSLREDRRECE